MAKCTIIKMTKVVDKQRVSMPFIMQAQNQR